MKSRYRSDSPVFADEEAASFVPPGRDRHGRRGACSVSMAAAFRSHSPLPRLRLPRSAARAVLVAMAFARTSAHAGDWTPVCQALREQHTQAIVTDGAGGAYVGWID